MRILAVMIITGLLLSVSSVYLNKLAFADDSWADITKRQQDSEQKAMQIYQIKYQNAKLNDAKRSWVGLTSTPTDETSRGRDIDKLAQMSMDNALAEFDKIHVKQLLSLQSDHYAGLASTPTDTQARDRNALIEQARESSLKQANDILAELGRISGTYTDLVAGATTDEKTIDRQAQIEKTWNDMEAKASSLVNSLAKIDSNYVNLSTYNEQNSAFVYSEGSTTNEKTTGRQLDTAQAYALAKAITIFEQIHEKRLSELQSSYAGLTNTPTDTNGSDRNADLEKAREASLQNALRVYSHYYGEVIGQKAGYAR